jgi:hypothetical protein
MWLFSRIYIMVTPQAENTLSKPTNFVTFVCARMYEENLYRFLIFKLFSPYFLLCNNSSIQMLATHLARAHCTLDENYCTGCPISWLFRTRQVLERKATKMLCLKHCPY